MKCTQIGSDWKKRNKNLMGEKKKLSRRDTLDIKTQVFKISLFVSYQVFVQHFFHQASQNRSHTKSCECCVLNWSYFAMLYFLLISNVHQQSLKFLHLYVAIAQDKWWRLILLLTEWTEFIVLNWKSLSLTSTCVIQCDVREQMHTNARILSTLLSNEKLDYMART